METSNFGANSNITGQVACNDWLLTAIMLLLHVSLHCHQFHLHSDKHILNFVSNFDGIVREEQ